MKRQFILLIHFGYWALYLAMLWLFFLAIQVGHPIQNRIGYVIGIGFSLVLLPSILGFYLSYFFLFKKYLQDRKILLLLGYTLIGLFFIAFISAGFISLIFGKDMMFKSGYESFFTELFLIGVISVIHVVLGFIIKGFISWYADLKIKEKLQGHTHKMELELIKSKLDPHFLFNTINNIDGMMIKDPEVASKYLDKLSTILRFMLYESKVEKIPILKEIEYIQKYIDLQKIRTVNPDFVNYTVNGTHIKHQIPPMLFIPFIENAFKHVAAKKSFHAIEINILIEKQKIIFKCNNNFNPIRKASNTEGGVGNELIEKRLQLLYPGKHQIQKSETDDIYSVELTIFTNEN